MSLKVLQQVLADFVYVLSRNYIFQEAQYMTNYYSDTSAFLHESHLCGCLLLAVKHLHLRTILQLRCDRSFH